MNAAALDAVSGSRFLVLGTGKSGLAAASALRKRGGEVETADVATVEAVRDWAQRGSGGTIIASPGISPRDPALVAARELGLRIRGELSLGCSLLAPHTRVVAVTGSKGKSSLVKFIADSFSARGMRAAACGNYGIPVCAVADFDPAPDVAVIECSSFQLETADDALAPEVAILLNLSRDHLDRHGSMEAYLDSKLSIFANMLAGSLALLPAPEEDGSGIVEAFCKRYSGRPFATFGAQSGADFGFAVPQGSYFDNPVLRPAAVAGAAALSHFGFAADEIAASLTAFEPLPHRMQIVARRGDLAWVDNSKATSLAALVASLKMAKPPILLLAGGRLKEPFSLPANVLLDSGVEKVYAFGECGPQMARAWSQSLPASCFPDLTGACAAAAVDSESLRSGTVLLAPGTASFDQFRSYGERGDLFATLAREHCDKSHTP